MRMKLATLAVLALGCLASGQTQWTTTYDSTGSRQIVDNLPRMISPSYNTWHNMNVALVDVTVSSRGHAEGVDANHCLWVQDDGDGETWTQDSASCVFVQAAPQDSYYRYGLGTAQSSYGCTGNYYPFYGYNGATQTWSGWGSSQNACILKGTLALSGNEMICGITAANKPACINSYVNGNGGNAFVQVAGVPSGTYISLIPVHDGLMYIATASTFGKCALTGSIGALSCAYTALPALTGMQMITGDSEGFVYAIASTSSGSNVYRLNHAQTAWQEIYGLIANRISVAGAMHIYATTSVGALYRTGESVEQISSVLTGHTICNGACPPGSSHTPNMNGAMPVQYTGSGPLSCTAVPPANDVNCSISQTPVDAMWCMLDKWPGGTECDIVGTAFMQCSIMGLVFQQAIKDHPKDPQNPSNTCFLGPPAKQPHRFVVASVINVYFDDGVWTAGGCPVQVYCQFFNGLNSWGGRTLLNYSFVNKGVVHPSSNCGGAAFPYGVYALPCNPSYPYIFVSNNKRSGDIVNDSWSGAILRSSKGQFTVIGVAARAGGAGGASNHDRTALAAHEFGHLHNLPDCYGLPICQLDEAHTVMYSPMTTNGPMPTAPTECDLDWANIYGFMNKEN